MDLNELYFHHQVAAMRADRSEDCGERRRLGRQADGLADRIGTVLRDLGAQVAPPAWIAQRVECPA